MKKLSIFIVMFALLGLNEAIAQWNTNGNNIYNSNTGNVGIGNTAPSTLLHVGKNMTEPTITVQNLGGIGGATYTMMDNVSGANWKFKATNAGGFKIRDHANGLDVFVIEPNSTANALYIHSGGNVGIHTDNPGSYLDVHYNDNGYARLGYSASKTNYFYHADVAADGDGQAAIYAYRGISTWNDGTDYSQSESNCAIKGNNEWGSYYSFGTTGFNINDFTRCGGILGAFWNGDYWGALGYKNSGSNTYGGYFSNYSSGGGKSSQPAYIGIGMGAWGDLFGADIHGKIYGIYAEGENYAIYSHGTVYKDGLDIHLQENGTKTSTVLYTNVSTDVTVMTSGTTNLSAGTANIAFDPAFLASVSSEAPVVVTVTPIGRSNGVFLSDVSADGFTVIESNDGKSNVTINYIAIGKRAGYENPAPAAEVIDSEYTIKLAGGLKADADLQTNGNGLYYENGQLVVGVHPSALPDPNKHGKTLFPAESMPQK